MDKARNQDVRAEARDGTPQRLAGEETHEQRIERLFREHNRTLIRFLRARLHSDQEAQEIAQEAYVRLLKLDEPDAVSYLRAFLFRTAANLASDRLKQKQRRRELRELVFFEQEVGRSPESGCLAREQLDLVRASIEELPPKCRMAFMLVKFGELTLAEVAGRMGLSTRMVRIYVARALAHCQYRLDQQ